VIHAAVGNLTIGEDGETVWRWISPAAPSELPFSSALARALTYLDERP
jgi:hypothetical protein